jgi:hypothetical protein
MAFNISSFNSNIGMYGVLPTSKFYVLMSPSPTLMGTLQTRAMINGEGIDTMGLGRLIQFRAEHASIPGLRLQTNDVKRYGLGVVEKMPYNAQFSDTQISFIADKNGSIYRYLYVWLTSIIDFAGQSGNLNNAAFTSEYKDNYVSDIDIYVFDQEGFLAKQITMFDAFPVSLNDIGLDWASQNSLMKITATFSFRSWKVNSVDITGGGGGISFNTLIRAVSSPTTAAYVVGDAIQNWILSS